MSEGVGQGRQWWAEVSRGQQGTAVVGRGRQGSARDGRILKGSIGIRRGQGEGSVAWAQSLKCCLQL